MILSLTIYIRLWYNRVALKEIDKLIVPEMTEKRSDLQIAEGLADKLVDALTAINPEEGSSLKWEVKDLKRKAEILAKKLAKAVKLEAIEKKPFRFVELQPDGTYRQLTKDEVYRKVMDYPRRGVNIIELIDTVNDELDRKFNIRQEAEAIFRALTIEVNPDGSE